ncbi:hypothetical protein [Listeria booriae]|uniref:hypothetical protein n=1 Tax=Listeria booriae TaxID=1552123 RepID=UPI0021ADD410|nr:hypothetical protein [Listeria booriae]
MKSVLQTLDELNDYSLQIGIFGEDNSFMQMVAGVQEFGLTIRPRGKYLTLPTEAAGGRSAREIPGLFKPRGKNILAVADRNGNLTVMFILKEEVKIPERSFLRSTFEEKNQKWIDFFDSRMDDIITGNCTAQQLYNQLGAVIVADIQMKIRDTQSPANSGYTAKRKGANNPLVDTGRLRQSVTWKVVR